ncbi:MAG: hypothetical protein KAS61_09585 [Spirochaetes bacterium]|nr:hypothetical protein [Spirochaetota bacterium]
MKFEYGDSDNPTGNAIIYWRLEGNTEVLENAEIVASNFVISPLQYKNETLMVNFPPVLIENHEQLFALARDNNIDLIRGEDVEGPDEVKDIYKFYKKQIKKYNGVLQQYLLAYKEKKSVNVSMMSLPQLINQADSIMRGVRKMVRKGGEQERIGKEIGKLREIQHYFDNEMKGFDLNGIIPIIDQPDTYIDQLVDLYRQKFLAIFLEDYEKARTLKDEIERLEKNIPS